MLKKDIIIGKATDSSFCNPISKVSFTMKDSRENILSTNYSSTKEIWKLDLNEEVYSAVFECT